MRSAHGKPEDTVTIGGMVIGGGGGGGGPIPAGILPIGTTMNTRKHFPFLIMRSNSIKWSLY